MYTSYTLRHFWRFYEVFGPIPGELNSKTWAGTSKLTQISKLHETLSLENTEVFMRNTRASLFTILCLWLINKKYSPRLQICLDHLVLHFRQKANRIGTISNHGVTNVCARSVFQWFLRFMTIIRCLLVKKADEVYRVFMCLFHLLHMWSKLWVSHCSWSLSNRSRLKNRGFPRLWTKSKKLLSH